MKKMTTIAVGTALTAFMVSGVANAVENPFGITENGYQVGMSSMPEGYYGAKDDEGKCGGDKAGKEGKCGGDKAGKEGKCGGNKVKNEGKCGGK